MADRVVTARTPGGQLVALPVVDLPPGPDGAYADADAGSDETAVADRGDAARGVSDLKPALAAIEDFSEALRRAVAGVRPRKATVEFTLAFGVQTGKVVAMFVDGKAEGSVKVTLEWGAAGAGDE
jgi:NTP-dependent ternary system trypsin peptidase co-occuring protein